MTLLQKLREKLGPELLAQVSDAVGDDFDWDVVPRSRLNTVIGQRNDLRNKLQNMSQNLNSNSAADDDDDADLDTQDKGNSKPNKSKNTGDSVADVTAKYEKQLADVKKRYAVLDKLRADGARDPELVLRILDFDKIVLKEDNTLEGYEDQITPKKESHKYLFEDPADDTQGGTGKDGGSDNDNEVDPFEAVIASYTK